MIVSVRYQFHDHESEMFCVDTEKLNTNDKFESAVKKALESRKKFVQLDGDQVCDEGEGGGISNKAKVKSKGVTIDHQCELHIFWDC